MSKNLIAERDGVMLKVGNEIRQLYKDGVVPDGADKDHVKILVDRGLLISADGADDDAADSGFPVGGSDEDVDAWVSKTKVDDVLAYAAEHPEAAEAILAAEKRGKARVSIVEKLEGS